MDTKQVYEQTGLARKSPMLLYYFLEYYIAYFSILKKKNGQSSLILYLRHEGTPEKQKLPLQSPKFYF